MGCGGKLSQRQMQAYKYKVNIYRIINPTGNAEAGPYNPTPHLTNVPCLFDSTPETDNPNPVGRRKTINIFVLDNFYFPMAYSLQNVQGIINVDVRDTDMIQMVFQPGGRTNLIGVFWVCQGNSQPQAFLTDDFMIYGKRIGTTPPAGLS